MLSLTELLLSVLFALLFYQILKWYHTRLRLFRTFSNLAIPGPEPGFWLGNLRFNDRNYVFCHLDTWFKRYGDFFGYYRGDRPVIVLRNLEMIHEVFVKRFAEFPNRLRFNMNVVPFSSSVLALRDKRWRHVRRIITPAFTAHKVSQLSTTKSILVSINRVFSTLKTASNQQITVESLAGSGMVINATYLSKAYTLDVISRIAFALEETDVFEPYSQLVGMVEEFMANCDGALIRLVFMFPFLARVLEFINNYLTSGRMIDMLSKHLKQLIDQYQLKEFPDVSEKTIGPDDVFTPKRNLLDYMLFQGKVSNLSQNETIGNLLVILFAGFETTACCLSFTLFNLAKHPEVQEKLRSELKTLLNADFAGSLERNHPLEELAELKCEYLDRIIYESLRLYPPVIDYVIREIGGDLDAVTLKCGLKVPKNVGIMLPVWQMHHDPTVWPDPYHFNPERDNLPIPGSSIKNFAFAAFGIGQRNCIGGNLAMVEMRQFLASLVLQYQIELVSDPRSPYAHSYSYDQNRLLQVECIAELIKPKNDIFLQLVSLTK